MDKETVALIRENERLKAALKGIQRYASAANFGGWRQTVYDMAGDGLRG